ncbi:hypothetical protein ABZW11_35770 [Nonomuraea sp. NPDC004580]|uniref:hypothetical protein n=1 Tax=Nonomuraea sp. NPDC004580 TaxID=3154552 RepID=UPI0033A9A70D
MEPAGARGVLARAGSSAETAMLRRSEITAPIVGATKERHVDDALAAVSVTLSDDEAAFLEQPYRPREVRF